MTERAVFLAKADQDLAVAKASLEDLIKDYGQNVARMETGDDEIDILCSLIAFLRDEPLSDDSKMTRAQYLSSYVAVAVKMLHDERHGQ